MLVLAVWSWLAGPLLPHLPPVAITYLSSPAAGEVVGVPVPAAEAWMIGFSGAFDIGGTAALEEALDAAPLARVVAFDSPGGRPLAAQGVAEVIRARHLGTTVRRYCASACTIAYVAGEERTAASTAQFAFHLGTGPFLADMAALVVLQIERKWFVRGGASLSFAERALHAPNDAPYVPAMDELLAAGYVHRVVPVLAGASQAAPDALLAAVSAVERQAGDALRWGIAKREGAGMSPARSRAVADQRAGLVVDRWLRHSSDMAVLGLIDATVTALTALNARDPAACMQWQIGLEDQDEAAAALPAPVLEAYRAAQVRVLVDANAYPVPTPVDGGSLAAADAVVRAAVSAEFGPTALAAAASREHGFDDPGRSCRAGLAYLRGLRARPEAATLLRWALAAG